MHASTLRDRRRIMAAKKAKKRKSKSSGKTGRVSTKSTALRYLTGSENFNELRKTARLDIPIKVRYSVASKGTRTPQGGVTKDISLGGCLLVVTEKLPIDTELTLEILLGEGGLETLTLSGRIVRLNRSQKGLYEYGITFNNLSSQGRRLFADYCFARMYEMIGLNEWPTDKSNKKIRRS